MEELLNKLIEKGWKPFPNEWIDCYDFKFSNRGHDLMCCSSDDDDEYTHNYTYLWRDIVSKESGLWQFVCENGMVYETPDDRGGPNYNWLEDLFNCGWKCPDYWLMESALCDEDKLEEFLLSNIKVGNEQL